MSEVKEEKKVNENGYGYSNKMVWSVPPKCVLVCKNKITGNTYVKYPGLQINLPFTRAKLIDVTSRTEGTDDKNSVTNKCLDGFEVTVNPAITTKIIDAEKYEFNAMNPEEELKVKVQQVIRKIIASFHYETLNGLEINLNSSRFTKIKNDFMDIENNYGIEVEKIYIQNVQMSQTMKDDYEKKVMQEKENERRLMEAENKKKVAQLEAEAEKLKLRAFKEVTLEFVTELQNKGLSSAEIEKALQIYIGTRGESDTRIVSLGNNESKVIDAATTGAVIKKIK